MKPILHRLLVFCGLFIVLIGVPESWVISTRLLNEFYFDIYGNFGKIGLVSLIIFGLLVRKRLKDLEKLSKIRANIFQISLSFFLVPLFFFLGNQLLGYKSAISNIPLVILAHVVLVLIPIFLLLGIFGQNFVKSFVRSFPKELLICLGIAIFYDLAIFQVWKLWPFFSNGVLQSVRFLLSLTSANVQALQPRTLVANNFAVSIGEACSGIDSLFLFSSLYLLIAILDFKQFNKIKLMLMFIPAAIGLYLVNIFRVYILVVIGAYVSADLSVKLFHTYLGMVFFIIYFFIFWKLSYQWMRK